MRKISRRSFLKAATVACALTALTACGGGDESAAASVAKDENGAYVDTLTITLGRFAEPSAAALFPEGQTFEDNAYTRYIESKLNVDLVDSFEAGGDAYTNPLLVQNFRNFPDHFLGDFFGVAVQHIGHCCPAYTNLICNILQTLHGCSYAPCLIS